MTTVELELTLQQLRSLTAETEIFEFKEAKNGYDFTKLGKYFSALSNEANLQSKSHAWLVFGIEDAPEEHYRNQFFATAMFNLKMVDTNGGGIRKMFNFQRERYFPLPDYDLSGGRVNVSITGKILNVEYARLLARNKDLTLEEIIMLDKVQKKQPITSFEEKLLKSIKQHGSLNRKDVDELLWNKLPDWMSDVQRKIKVNNLLSELRRKGDIENTGSYTKPKKE